MISYKKVTELDPVNPDIWIDYAELFAKEKMFDDAISILDKGIESDPRNASNFYRRSIYLLKKGKTKEAHLVIENALVIDYLKHSELFEYMPQLRNDSGIINLIELFRTKKEK
jgi:tetratricopeptide (TPR) repeat protein